MPSWELFEQQDDFYQELVLPHSVKYRLSIEMGCSMGWERWVGEHGASLSIDHFGASAPYEKILNEFGFTVENVVDVAKRLLKDPAALRRELRAGHKKMRNGHISSAPAVGSEGHS